MLPGSLLVRPRLLGRLQGRWSQRRTVIVAGAGCGKTTLLTQAITENRLAPRGEDIYLACRPADDAASLSARAVSALGADPDRSPLAEVLAAKAPQSVCLVLDDLQHLDAVERGELVDHLDRLPANTTAVLASRRPPWPDAAVDIDERELIFDRDELGLLAGDPGELGPTLEQTGGWPALVAQLLQGGGPTTREGIPAQIVERLSADDRTTLGALASIGPASPDLVTAAGGDVERATRLCDELPLLRLDPDGRFVVHDLWVGDCRDLLEPAEQRAARLRAAEHLSDHAEHEAALDLAAAAGDWDLVLALAVPACNNAASGMARRVARRLVGVIPASHRHHPGHLLVDAVDRRNAAPQAPATRAAFRSAIVAFESVGDVDGEVYARLALAYLEGIAGGDLGAATVTLERVRELGSRGHRLAREMTRLTDAVLTMLTGDTKRSLDLLDAIDRSALTLEWRTTWTYLRSVVLLAAGRADEAVDPALVAWQWSIDHGIGGQTGPMVSLVLSGRLDEAREKLDRTSYDESMTPSARLDRGLHRAWLLALQQRPQEAREFLEDARGSTGDDFGAWLLAVEALILVAEGDEEAAADVLGRVRPSALPWSGGQLAARDDVAVRYVLRPDERPGLDDRPFEGCWEESRSIGRHLAALRDGGSPRSVELPAGAKVVGHLGIRLAVELAVRLAASGRAAGARLLVECVELVPRGAASCLVELSAAPGPLRKAARQLVGEVPIPPRRSVELGLLGPTRLVVDGGESGAADWRRERVRALLAYLVHHRRAHREVIGAALWPQLAQDRVARNLAVTVNYLNNVLEPDRISGGATWYVRGDRTSLWINDDDTFVVDAWRFEAFLAEASAEADRGATTTSLALLERAIGLWRGDYLDEMRVEEWAQLPIDRFRARFVAASVRASELLGASGRFDEAVDRASRALDLEPWSEAAYRATAAAQFRSGDRASAVHTLERCRHALSELGVAPEPSTQELMRAVGRVG